MKRLLAISVLTIGLLPSIPVFIANAAVPSQDELNRHCRSRLGYAQTEPLVGSSVFQLRRCISSTKKQYEALDRFQNKLQRYDQTFWKRYEYGQTILHESQRGLDKRMENQEQIRERYYKTKTVQEREIELSEHRRSRRTIVRQKEQQLLLEKRAQRDTWKKAIQTCTYYPRENREMCVQQMLTK